MSARPATFDEQFTAPWLDHPDPSAKAMSEARTDNDTRLSRERQRLMPMLFPSV
jgi:hypothetical protein